jgi:large subunit ribosomal protein L22
MEVKAKTKFLPISSQKLKLVCDQVRGLDARSALIVLEYMPEKGADFVRKTVASALANAENNFELDPEAMYISEIWAGEGPRLKRYKAGARGRFKPRVRRLSHLWVTLAEREEAAL